MRIPVSPAAFKSFICARISPAASFGGGGSFTRPRAVSTSSPFNSPSASWPISPPGGAGDGLVRPRRKEATRGDGRGVGVRDGGMAGDVLAVVKNRSGGLRVGGGAGEGENAPKKTRREPPHRCHASSPLRRTAPGDD